MFGFHIFLGTSCCGFAKNIENEKYIKVFSGEVGTQLCELGFYFDKEKEKGKFKIKENIKSLVLFYLLEQTPNISTHSKKQTIFLNEKIGKPRLYLKEGEFEKFEQFLTKNRIQILKKEAKIISLYDLKTKYINLIKERMEDLKIKNNDLAQLSDKDRNYFISFEKEKIKRETNNTENNLEEFFKDEEKLEEDGRKSVKLKIKENEDNLEKYSKEIKEIKKINKKDFLNALDKLNFSSPIIRNKKDNFAINIKFNISNKSENVFSKNLYLTWLKFMLVKYMKDNKVIFDDSSDLYQISLQKNLIYFKGSVDDSIFFLDSKKNLEKIKKYFLSKSFENFKKENFNEKNFKEFVKYFLSELNKKSDILRKDKDILSRISPYKYQQNIVKDEIKKTENVLKDLISNGIAKESYKNMKKRIKYSYDLLKNKEKLEKLGKLNLPKKQKKLEKEINEIKDVIKILNNIDFKVIERVSHDYKFENVKIYYKG